MSHTYGMVRDGGQRPHQGWDLEAPVGTPVYAIEEGKVVDVRPQGAYGKELTLEFTHNGQKRYAFYAHLSAVFPMEGDEVREGELIGFTGKTGNASNLPADEEHLHFEIRTRPHTGKGLGGHLDPGSVLGFGTLSCRTSSCESESPFGQSLGQSLFPAKEPVCRPPAAPWDKGR
jgi:murein DD-endopeptidase MepM/ murein hydrolase activator NlpD